MTGNILKSFGVIMHHGEYGDGKKGQMKLIEFVSKQVLTG